MLLCPWDFLGRYTGVVCHILLQGIFPTQGLNLSLRPGSGDFANKDEEGMALSLGGAHHLDGRITVDSLHTGCFSENNQASQEGYTVSSLGVFYKQIFNNELLFWALGDKGTDLEILPQAISC